VAGLNEPERLHGVVRTVDHGTRPALRHPRPVPSGP
jgi:hypothetical protein